LKNFITIFFSAVLCLSVYAEDNEVFNKLNLSYPGLEKVSENVKNENYQQARIELLKYYQTRTNRTSDFDETLFTTDEETFSENINNIFSIKNSTIDFGTKIDWRKINEDKEWQFSLCRMNWFNNFVGMYNKTRNEKIIEVWQKQIISWINLNEPGFPRTIDTGRRLENLVMSHWKFVTEFKSLTVSPEFNASLLLSMYEQAEWLLKTENWRRYSNWGTFESSGFLLFAILYPEFELNEELLKEAYFRMRTQLNYSFYPDGMHIETSPSYHSHELKVWFDFIKLTELNNISDPWSPQNYLEPIDNIIIRNAKALMHSYKPTGFMPQLGDTDHDNEISLLYNIGKYYNEADLIYVGSMGKEGIPPKERSITYPQGGYTFIRSGWGKNDLSFEDELYLNFDSGLNKPWHAHYDILSVNITAYGKDLVRDAGRFTYNDEPERDAFMSTAYHNTVTVDSKSQSRYERPLPATLKSFEHSDYTIASHKGYEGVNHTRSVFFVNSDYWVITDFLTSNDRHNYKQKWHLSENALNNIAVDEKKHKVTAPNVIIYPVAPEELKIEDGFLSYRYREKFAAPVVSVNRINNDSSLIASVIIPYKEEIPNYVIEKIETEIGVELIKISGQDFTDYYYESFNPAEGFSSKILKTDGKAIFIRQDRNHKISYLVMINGSYVKFNDTELISVNNKCDIEATQSKIIIKGSDICSFGIYSDGEKEIMLNDSKINAVQDEFGYYKRIIN
jgi:hypothetical protein